MEKYETYENYEDLLLNVDNKYPLVPLSDAVVFPGHSLSFSVNDRNVVSALLAVANEDREVFFATFTKANALNGRVEGIVGTVAKIRQIIKNSSGGLNIIAHGRKRMQISGYIEGSPYGKVELCDFSSKDEDPFVLEATKNAIISAYSRVTKYIPKLANKEVDLTDIDSFIGESAGNFYSSTDERYKLLATPSRTEQLNDVLLHIENKCRVLSLQRDIESKVRNSIDKNQREYYLREQIKVLHKELGDDTDEINEYREKLAKKVLPDFAREKAEKELSRLSKMPSSTPESAIARSYLDLILELPWTEEGNADINLNDVRRILDQDHYGLEKVKLRIVEYLAVCSLKKDMKAPVLCFVGPPGVGKTSIVKSIARAIGRQLVTVSLGGVRDEAEIRGHRRTYVGALPGRIISGLRDASVKNPVFLLDEIDKMTSDFRGDPSSALLEVLDVNQNDKFKDHYLEMGFDLSKVMFVTTANSIEAIDSPLLDRMEVIEIGGYTYSEKLAIARKYLLPKQCDANGVKLSSVSLSDEAIIRIIRRYTRESGVRNLERQIGSVIRKIAVKLLDNPHRRKFNVTEKNLFKYLGKEVFSEDVTSDKNEVGVVTGLAWTSYGGATLDVEVSVLPGGKGETRLTGNLGDVMKESALTATSLVRARAEEFGIDPTVFADSDIHVHVPEGATPKDGPSAGITMATAIASALSHKSVRGDVAMTGEITLRGKVLPIGGLKEKSLAALRAGKTSLIVPKENEKDFDEIPAEVKERVTIYPVSTIDEVFGLAFV